MSRYRDLLETVPEHLRPAVAQEAHYRINAGADGRPSNSVANAIWALSTGREFTSPLARALLAQAQEEAR